ncbi:MAG: DUF1330 domain-containing protein [Gammaproteobacteria bacterium AqS3]|nr:DUF1330 domain-containing protein [Gammaproteobacteria bacterium AqS3]
MKVKNALYPEAEYLRGMMADESGRPVAMVNLLRFRKKPRFEGGEIPPECEGLSGQEVYMQLYGAPMRQIVEREGGRFLFHGEVEGLAIGTAGKLWDAVAIVQYPSAADFARIVSLPEVLEITRYRAAGLSGQLLIQTDAVVSP